ncbi:hypothetical protein PLICRDRAFT_89194 [Plicaturopsis crispa FD-325 SS-3]|nr:hypothetical protein PLICRDRAFT_89194 [Plicaturopsis crispa FD-325 SS-3]
MPEGPPPSAAGPSNTQKKAASPAASQTSPPPTATAYPAGYQQSPSYYGYPQGSSTWQSPQNTQWTASDTHNANAWPSQPYQYATAPGQSHYPQYAYTNPSSTYPLQQQQPYAYYPHAQASTKPTVAPKARTPTPSPLPFHKYWDKALAAFFTRLGLTQTLRGLEADMIVMNPDWEQGQVPGALEDLVCAIQRLGDGVKEGTDEERTLEERKLDYVQLEGSAEPRSHTSTTKEISKFLARNRARNDASNRTEFLHARPDGTPSCARVDAKTIDRDVQMKYDIAQNEEGPLRRTMRPPGASEERAPKRRKIDGDGEEEPTTESHPAFDERLRNIEAHVAVRYVPAHPRTLALRIKYLEDHIVRLEKEYPPWAALHFNQPRRGWPPPPRPTPIIVPSHLTSTVAPDPPAASSTTNTESGSGSVPPKAGASGMGKPNAGGRTKASSLHRAVMEKLEVQKAMSDLRRVDDPGGRPSS